MQTDDNMTRYQHDNFPSSKGHHISTIFIILKLDELSLIHCFSLSIMIIDDVTVVCVGVYGL